MELYILHDADMERSTGKMYVECCLMCVRGGARRVLVGKSEVKRPLGRPRHRCDELQKVGWVETWTGLVWLRIWEDSELL
jgi:hypothetical protein